jgi:hypothetical protein
MTKPRTLRTTQKGLAQSGFALGLNDPNAAQDQGQHVQGNQNRSLVGGKPNHLNRAHGRSPRTWRGQRWTRSPLRVPGTQRGTDREAFDEVLDPVDRIAPSRDAPGRVGETDPFYPAVIDHALRQGARSRRWRTAGRYPKISAISLSCFPDAQSQQVHVSSWDIMAVISPVHFGAHALHR